MTIDSSDIAVPSGVDPLPATLKHDEFDIFLSYSRKDEKLAEALYRSLSRYRLPVATAPRRRLRVFRDVHDLFGTALSDALRRRLDRSARVVVLCSPAARASRYVEAEIQHYSETRGPERIIPVLAAGVPNTDGVEEERAFPEALLGVLSDPLAADFRGFDTARGRITRGRFHADRRWILLFSVHWCASISRKVTSRVYRIPCVSLRQSRRCG